MDLIGVITDQAFIVGVATSIVATIIWAWGAYVLDWMSHSVKRKSANVSLTGFWIVTFAPRYIPDRHIVEIFHFRRSGIFTPTYRFSYQHFDPDRYSLTPLFGGGMAISRGRDIAGFYGLDERQAVAGTILLRVDHSTSGRHSPRLAGSYYEYDDNRVAQTHKDKYILRKTALPLRKRLAFRLGRSCMTGYHEARAFCDVMGGKESYGGAAKQPIPDHGDSGLT